MSISTISVISIILGLVILMGLSFRNFPVYAVGIIASLVVIIGSRMELMPSLEKSYSSGFVSFAQANFLMLLMSSFFAKLMEVSGATRVIAFKLISLLKHFKKNQKFAAIVIMGSITGLFTLGGINLFVTVFLLVGIYRELAQEIDLPWHYYMASCWASSTFCMTMIPGSPAIPNLIPIPYLGTDASAAPVLGILSAIFCLFLILIYLWVSVKQSEKKGEGFLPTGALIKDQSISVDMSMPDIPLWKCLVPSIVILVVLNGPKFAPFVSLAIGCLVAWIIFHNQLQGIKQLFADGAFNALTVCGNVGAIVGFGSVVAASPGFTAIINALDSIPGTDAIKVVVSISIAAGATGSASGGLGLGLEALGDKLLALDLPPAVIHRLATISCGTLDSLPHSGGTFMMLGVGKLTLKNSYKHIFWTCTVIPAIVSVFAILLVNMGILY